MIKFLGKLQIKSLYLHPHSSKEYDSIAQLVEHITFNDGVLGSSPSRVTKGCSHSEQPFLLLGHVEKR